MTYTEMEENMEIEHSNKEYRHQTIMRFLVEYEAYLPTNKAIDWAGRSRKAVNAIQSTAILCEMREELRTVATHEKVSRFLDNLGL